MLTDDLHFSPAPPLFILPAILFQPPYDPNTTSLLQIIGAVFSQFGPDFHIEIGNFVDPVPLVLIKTVGGYGKLAEFCSFGSLSRLRITNEVSLEKDGI